MKQWLDLVIYSKASENVYELTMGGISPWRLDENVVPTSQMY